MSEPPKDKIMPASFRDDMPLGQSESEHLAEVIDKARAAIPAPVVAEVRQYDWPIVQNPVGTSHNYTVNSAEVRRAPIDFEDMRRQLDDESVLSLKNGELLLAEVARLTAERDELRKELDEAKAQALDGYPIDASDNLDIECDDARLVYCGLAKDAPLWALVASLALQVAEITREDASQVEALRTRLRGLEQQWRDTLTAKDARSDKSGVAISIRATFHKCADELASLLTTPETT